MHIEHSSPPDCASIAKGDNRERSGFQQMRGVNRRARPLVFSALLLLLGLLFCTTLLVRFPAASVRLPAVSAQAQSATIRFAVTGDYGDDTTAERDVANLVKSWNPDFVITVGDNNYPDGTASSIDANIGQYYHSFIFPYTGTYGDGATTNRFFPCLGNHDWVTT